MPVQRWWEFKAFVDWRLRLKSDEDSIDFDRDGWGDFDG